MIESDHHFSMSEAHAVRAFQDLLAGKTPSIEDTSFLTGQVGDCVEALQEALRAHGVRGVRRAFNSMIGNWPWLLRLATHQPPGAVDGAGAEPEAENIIGWTTTGQPLVARQKREGGARDGKSSIVDHPSVLELPEISTEFVLGCLAQDEWGDSLLFAQLFRDAVVFDHSTREWYLWQKHFWKKDATRQVRHLVSGVLASAYLRAAADLNLQASEQDVVETAEGDAPLNQSEEQEIARHNKLKKHVKALSGRALGLRTLKRNSNVLSFTTSHLKVTEERWDTDKWLLGTPAGVIDLQTGALRDGRPGDYIRTIIPTEWRGLHERCTRFERFLQEVFDDRPEEVRQALISFLQRILGYGITGNVDELVFLMLFGPEGRNGKDTLMSILARVLGSTVGAISNDCILTTGKMYNPGSAKPHLCSLQGKRIAWASETERGARFDVAQIKLLTGGGSIAARQIYGQEYSFEPSHLLVLMTNHRPQADPKEKAFWERICPVTFNIRFVDRPVEPNERKRDLMLKKALEAEASGILAWLVRGCLQWQQQGLDIPEDVLSERARYQRTEDTLGRFIADCCLEHPQERTYGHILYERYRQWAEENELDCMSGTAFGREVSKRIKKERDVHGFFYRGLAIRHP